MKHYSSAAENLIEEPLGSYLTLSPSIAAAQMPRYDLTPLQRKIVGLIQFDARLSVAEIARTLTVREGSVRYAIQALRENQIIYFSPLIDLSKLGLTTHTLLFSLNTKDRDKIERARNFLSSAPQITYASEIGGKFQFASAFVSRTVSGIAQFMQLLEHSIGDILLEKQLATHLQTADFRADYISQERGRARSIRWGGSTDIEKIDRLDHLILSKISAANFVSFSSLARSIELPISTVEFRLKRMEDRGIILAYRNLICSGRLGAQRLWMSVVVKGSTGTFVEQFFRYCESNPFVRYASCSIGGWDFDIGFDAPTAPASSTIIEDITRGFGERLLHANTVPLFKTARYVAYPFDLHPESYL